MATLFLLFLHSLIAMAASRRIHAVEYNVTNTALGTAGGTRFQNEIGIPYTKQTLQSASSFIWQTFKQGGAERKRIYKVTAIIESMDGVAYAINNEIHVSANYIAGYSGNVKTEITGVLYHEMVHIWQWNGNGQTPGGLIEGIADFVRLKAGYAPSHWKKAGQGDRWDQGYEVTAYFLDYCNSLKDGFVAELNRRMRTGYSSNLFVELLGKTVDQLWKDYKAKYGGS
ncbi:pathogenesis-related protein 17 [Cinnamomum micranthum f. kanehirae]|uniref:Pathogenesis-related protein 17 n=1 Tax=Cinnamomum micranthum f. kanehirae TaxID=337451 RepID=A0A3S3NC62_9MAGN|nr:pathogenesis-related protein 17 [Cinnamomum micranthum f. kanehirae]